MAKKEKPFMELSREQFNELFEKNWDKANKNGYNEGYINGLALTMAYIYEHVEDMAASSPDHDIVSKFNYAFEKAKKKIAAQKRREAIAKTVKSSTFADILAGTGKE